MDFRPGGRWRYAMTGPGGESHYCLADYSSVTSPSEFKALDAFCDEAGNINQDWPRSKWEVRFVPREDATTVEVTIRYEDLADLEKSVEMGFQEGFSQGLAQLDQLLTQR